MPEKKPRFINPLLQPSIQPVTETEPEPVTEQPAQPATTTETKGAQTQPSSRRLAAQLKQAEPAQPEAQSKEPMYRTTIYLSKEDLLLLDRYRTRVFETTGNRLDRSEMIREAIKLYAQQFGEDKK